MEENKPLISVIVPVYNVQRYVRHCIKSLISQTYRFLEIIVIIDASPDQSLDRVRKIVDSRIQIIELKENIGVERCRFLGIERSTGKYLMFVDADDFLYRSNAVDQLLDAAIRTDADVVEGGFVRTMDDGCFISTFNSSSPLVIEQPDLLNDYFVSFFGINKLSVSMCGKLYKRELFERTDLKPNGMKMGEDLVTNMELFPYIKRYTRIEKPVYCYRYGGMTSRYNPTLWHDLKLQYEMKMEMIQHYDYKRALNPSKIEMCNVLCTNIEQMICYQFDKEDIKRFFEGEVASGFIDRITEDIQSNRLNVEYIRNKDFESLFNLCQSKVNKNKWRRLAKRCVWRLFTFIQR